MAKKDVQVNVRLPDWLLRLLRDAADRHGRSLTAEIATRLEDSFPTTLEDVQLESITNALYVAQALQTRLMLRLDTTRHGSAARAKIEQQLRDIELEIDRIRAERDRWIDEVNRRIGEHS